MTEQTKAIFALADKRGITDQVDDTLAAAAYKLVWAMHYDVCYNITVREGLPIAKAAVLARRYAADRTNGMYIKDVIDTAERAFT